MKERYESPELEIIEIDAADIIFDSTGECDCDSSPAEGP